MRRRTLMAACVTAAAMSLAATASMAGEALDRVMADGVLKIATDAAWAPQSFVNDNNEMDGFDVDVGKEIARRLGVTAEFVTPGWEIITAGNWVGRWDISVGSMTPTAERAKILTFPAVYYYTPASFAVHKDSAAQDKTDLNGLKIGAVTGTTWEQYLQQDLVIEAEGAPTFEYDVQPGAIHSLQDASAVLDDLRLGDGVRVDGLLDSLPSILAAIESGYPFRVVGTPAFFEPLALAIDKGDAEFNDKLAAIVKEMQADGALTEISMKWYGVDYTSTN